MNNERLKRGNVLKKLKGSKKFMVLLVFGVIFMMGSVLAFYILSYTSTTTYTVLGGVSAFGIIQDLQPTTILVNESLSDTQDIIIENSNGVLDMNYTIETAITNLDVGNCDIAGDISFLLERNSTEIAPNSSFVMNPGNNTFSFTVEAVNDRVCPSLIDVDLTFE